MKTMSDIVNYYESLLHQCAAIAEDEGASRVSKHLERHGFDASNGDEDE